MLTWGSDSDMETLAAVVRKKGNDIPGVAFARSANEKPEKSKARDEILKLLTVEKFPRLNILTMPGALWTFERQLIHMREDRRILKRQWRLENTFIRSIEKDPAIFAASLRLIPATWRGYKMLSTKSYSLATMSTDRVVRYNCATFEDYVGKSDHCFDAAWLDFTGPVTERLLEVLPQFWKRIEKLLVLTFLNARYSINVGDRMRAAGGTPPLLLKVLPGSRLVHELTYFDTVPMLQLGFEK